jgi:hypothetical protein
MARPVFGVTDSPRAAARKRKEAERAEALLERDRPYLWRMERDAEGLPCRLVAVRNPHYRRGSGRG